MSSNSTPADITIAAGGRPLVSIIIPSYNQGRFIRATLDSVLSQDYRPIEVLVMDGASKDETVTILREYAAAHPELRWWSEPDKGVVDAVNKGLARASGPYAGIQSSDDIYLPGAISSAVGALGAHSEVDIVYGDAYVMNEGGQLAPEYHRWAPYTLENLLCRATFIFQNSAFFRLDAARAVGGWRDRYFIADLDLWLRMVMRRPAFKVDEVWSAWRIQPDQRNRQKALIWESHWRMIEENEDLRRAPLRLRLAARAGCRMFAEHYNPGSRWYQCYQLWLGLFTYPPSYRALQNKTLLVPGLARMLGLFQSRRQ